MPSEELSFKRKVFSSFLWLSTGTFIGQSISWISTLIVIRLLLPSDYGLIGMAAIFIALLTTVSELGIGASIIQAHHLDDTEISQIFGFLILTCISGVVLTYLGAPVVASFFNENKLISLIRLLSLNFILLPFYSIHEALLIREMNFKKKAQLDIMAQVGSALVTLSLALQGFGVWALAAGTISLHGFKAIGYSIHYRLPFAPTFRFNGSRKLINFGMSVTGSRLLHYFSSQSDTIIVGKVLGGTILGIYGVALNLASIPVEKVLPIITQVSFTSYARIQNDMERVRRNVLRATRTIALFSFPLFFGMVSVAPQAIPLLLGPKWVGIILPFQLICFILPLKALSPILPPAISAVGRPKINVITTAITLAGMTTAFLIGVHRGGLFGVCLSWIIAYPIVFFINIVINLRVLGISSKQYLADITFPFFASATMLILIFSMKELTNTMVPQFSLFVAVVFGLVYYGSLFFLFQKDRYRDLISLVRK